MKYHNFLEITVPHKNDKFEPGMVDGTVSITISSAANLDEMCDAFQRYLKACGYVFDGEVQIVNEQ